MSNNKVHSIDTLRTRSLLPTELQNPEEPQDQKENLVVSCKPSLNLKSMVKNGQQQQKIKRLRFQNPIQKIHIVENWKKHNLPYEDTQECCCTIF